MMYAVVCWCDGFGNDSYVSGIYQTLEEAISNANLSKESDTPDKIVEFNFGKVNFDYYECTCITRKRKNKKRKKC